MTTLDFGSLVLGGNVFGWTADRDESFAVLDAFVAAGGRSIDTADVYSAWVPGNAGGESETILGEWFASRGNRADVVVATKVFMLEARPGLSPANIAAAVDDSLARLQSEYIDLYYAHRDDADIPQEEYVAAFDALVTAGKVREVGASGFSADRLASAVAIADAAGQSRFTVAQDQWSLVERGIESTNVQTLAELGIVELPFSSLASGFLTGKYRAGANIDSPRAGSAGAYLNDPANVALLGTLDEIAAAHDVSVSAVSLAWLRAQPVVGAPIASARTLEQLVDIMQVVELDAAELARLSA
jgi:aryl-alcohol dehydrogenase-like predicted oxidoreductase